jgi:predicted pyridoxine 5'-phosphate oxidase superfamily flavin-nucleotide-binding protein
MDGRISLSSNGSRNAAPGSAEYRARDEFVTLDSCGWHGGGRGSPSSLPRSRRAGPRPAPAADLADLPGSAGEHALQCAYGSQDRAARFYTDQVRDRLLPTMVAFVGRMEMVFVATSDGRGECDSSLRAGPPGFVRVLDDRTVAYPEYRGNGVHASLGNISENAHVGLLMVDFVEDLIGLHVNGVARIVEDAEFRAVHPALPVDAERGRRPERWVVVEVEEAYIHCRKHIPRMARVTERREWGTDDPGRKGGDYFGARGAPALRARRPRPRRRFPTTTHLGGAGTARKLR